MKVSLKFEPRDLWIGLYWTIERSYSSRMMVYLCIVPTLPIVFEALRNEDEGWELVIRGELSHWKRSLVNAIVWLAGGRFEYRWSHHPWTGEFEKSVWVLPNLSAVENVFCFLAAWGITDISYYPEPPF